MTRTRPANLTIFALALAFAVQAVVAATPPALISYQGVLRSAAGEPLEGTFDLVFRFTDSAAGGTLLLTDYHSGPNAVVVDGGLFTTLLGGGTLSPGTESSLQDIFARYSSVYVEVQVGAETLAPRVRVVSTGFALNAGRLGGQLPDGYLDTSPVDQVKQGSLTSNTSIVAQSNASFGEVRALSGTTVSSAGIGVLGSALADGGATEGVRGQSTSPDGRGVVGAAFAASGPNVGVLGESQSSAGAGVHGRATAESGGTVGALGEAFSPLGTGVVGVTHATSGDAWGVYGETASPTGYGVVSVGDSITAGDIYATGTKYFLAEHPLDADSAIRFACLEGGEVGVYWRGSGRLQSGEAHVELPEPFALVAAGRITVQVTPQEECGGLYVPPSGVSSSGFTVREAGGARSDTGFTYLVMAERSGYEDAESVRPISVSDKVLTSRRLSATQKTTLRAALSPKVMNRIDAEQLTALYSALQVGDYDESCRLLDGCGIPPGSPADPVRRNAAQSRRDPARPDHPLSPGVATGTREREANRMTRTTPSVEVPEPAPRPAAVAPPASSLATLHVVSETVEAGDVVVLDRLNAGAVRLGDENYDPRVVGVVVHVDGQLPAGELAPVAVAGIVPCNVDAEYGWIAPGDLLVVSPTPGHAMRAADPAPGTVLGKALESLGGGQGTISILLMPG